MKLLRIFGSGSITEKVVPVGAAVVPLVADVRRGDAIGTDGNVAKEIQEITGMGTEAANTSLAVDHRLSLFNQLNEMNSDQRI